MSTTTRVDRPLACTVSNGMENSCFGKGEVETLPNERQASSLSNKKEEDKPSDIGANEPEKITIEQAAVIVQAFFRGYQVLALVSLFKSYISFESYEIPDPSLHIFTDRLNLQPPILPHTH